MFSIDNDLPWLYPSILVKINKNIIDKYYRCKDIQFESHENNSSNPISTITNHIKTILKIGKRGFKICLMSF